MYKINEFSKMTGLNPSKIRFYEKNGLFKAKKDINGYRYFTAKDAFKVNAFRVLIGYGFTVGSAIEMINRDMNKGWFLETLKNQKTEIEKIIELNNCRLQNLDYVIELLEDQKENHFEVITMQDFLYVYASKGKDFSISKINGRTISKFTDILSITFCARIIKQEDLSSKNSLVQPSYVCAIPVGKEKYLGCYDKSQVNYFNLGKCIRYLRRSTREESGNIQSFNHLFDYIEKNNYSIRGDILLVPTFLNLNEEGADIETLYIPIK